MNERQRYQAERKRRTGLLLGMLGATLLLAVLFLFAGRYPTAGFRFPTDWATNAMTRSIFLRIRLPVLSWPCLPGQCSVQADLRSRCFSQIPWLNLDFWE